MNIAFATNVVYPFVKGGTEKRVHEIGHRLADRGHEITIYGRHWWDGPAEIEREGMLLRGVSPKRDLFAGDRRSIPEALEFGKDLVPSLTRHANEHDIVVASMSAYFPLLGARIGTLLQNTPLVTTWHEVWGEYWKKYLGRLSPAGKTVEWLTANVPQHPVAVSSMTANRLAQIGPAREDIDVIPNGVDVDWIRSLDPASDGFDVLYAGRLIPDKNVDILLDAFDRVAGEYDITLGIIGEGPELASLKTQAASMTHADRVTFLGFLAEYDDVLTQMRTAELFVSPSTREGFGITFVEAMAADCTVITVEHPNTPADEIVGNGGFITDVSAPAVADAMRQALAGKTPKQNPIERAYKYDWPKIATQAEEVYQSTING